MQPVSIFLLLKLIPIVNIAVEIVTMIKLAKAFDETIGFALCLIFLRPIFICVLGFGYYEYEGIPD